MKLSGYLLMLVCMPCMADQQIVESQVFETTGTQAEISKRGESCIARFVRNEQMNNRYTSGPVIVSVQADSVIANNRLFIKAKSFLGIDEVLQSTLTFMAKDGRFKLRHDNILWGIPDSRYALEPIEALHAKAPGRQNLFEALDNLDLQIAQCVQQESAETW